MPSSDLSTAFFNRKIATAHVMANAMRAAFYFPRNEIPRGVQISLDSMRTLLELTKRDTGFPKTPFQAPKVEDFIDNFALWTASEIHPYMISAGYTLFVFIMMV